MNIHSVMTMIMINLQCRTRTEWIMLYDETCRSKHWWDWSLFECSCGTQLVSIRWIEHTQNALHLVLRRFHIKRNHEPCFSYIKNQTSIANYRVILVVSELGWVDSDLRYYPGWWAATVTTYCPGRMVEHVKSKPNLPNSETIRITL